MKVTVNAVVFRHPEPTAWGVYCSYCPELQYFYGRGNTIQEVIERIREHLFLELSHRGDYANLTKLYGWMVSENSIKVPTFTESEMVKLAEKSYELKIEDFQIIPITMEVPPVKILW